MKIEEFEELLKNASPTPWAYSGHNLSNDGWIAEFENSDDQALCAFLANNAEKFLALWKAAKDSFEHYDPLLLQEALEDLEK